VFLFSNGIGNYIKGIYIYIRDKYLNNLNSRITVIYYNIISNIIRINITNSVTQLYA